MICEHLGNWNTTHLCYAGVYTHFNDEHQEYSNPYSYSFGIQWSEYYEIWDDHGCWKHTTDIYR